jgi:hypothetical protein
VAEGTSAVRRAFKFRAYPTRPQEGRAVRLLADHCDLYNAALEERREAWRMRRVSVSCGMQSAHCRRECTRPRQDTVICPTHGNIDADLNGHATSPPGPG